MAKKAAAVGASFFAANALFLKSCSRPTYLSFVREHFPHLSREYAERFSRMDFADEPYRQQLALRVKQACRKYGLGERSSEALFTRGCRGAARRSRRGCGAHGAAQQELLFA